MQYLLPLFLMFCFSAQANLLSKISSFSEGNIVRCFGSNKINKLVAPEDQKRAKQINIQVLARETLGKPIPFKLAQDIAFMVEELPDDFSASRTLEILRQLKEQGFSKKEINNIFIPMMLAKFDPWGELQDHIARSERVIREDFKIKRKLTPFQALQLFSFNKEMVSKKDITPSEVAEALENIGKFSKKEIVRIIIDRANTRSYNFGNNLINTLARGHMIAHEILERSVTPEQALILFFIEKEDLISFWKTINESENDWGFTNAEIIKLMSDHSYKGFKLEVMDKLPRGQQIARVILGRKVTVKESQGLAFLEKELSNGFSSKLALEALEKLKEQVIYTEEMDDVFMPVLLDPKFNGSKDLQNHIAQGQQLARLNLKIKRKLTSYQALQLFSFNKEMVSKEDITPSEVAEALEKIGGFSKKEIVTFIIKVANSYDYNFGKNLTADLNRGSKISREILKRQVAHPEALGLVLIEQEILSKKPRFKSSKVQEALEGFEFSKEDRDKFADAISSEGFKAKKS